MKITEKDFKDATGRKPVQDDLERVNCKSAGHAGHVGCGWCFMHNLPKFECFNKHIKPAKMS